MPADSLQLAELLAALSLASDLGMGQPLEHALRRTMLAMRLATRLGLDDAARSDVFYVGLLYGVGCVADAHDFAAYFAADDIALKAAAELIDPDDRRQRMRILREVGRTARPLARPAVVARALVGGRRVAAEGFRGRCEVASVLARRLGLGEAVRRGLLLTFDRWDGHGINRLRGEDLPLPTRIVAVAHLADVFFTAFGAEAALATVRARAGRDLDPTVADALIALERTDPPWEALRAPTLWSDTLALEPAACRRTLETSALDEIATAFADFADLKSPFFVGHSRGVASLAAGAATRLRLLPEEVTALRRAALLHDLGRTGVPNSVLDKPAALSPGELERVRLHPYYSERILARSGPFAPVAPLAGAHHERLDGSGYHRGSRAAQLPPVARILAAADVYQALTERRAHRSALRGAPALAALRDEVRRGRLDSDAIEAVAAAAAGRGLARPAPTTRLSGREVEVLRLVAGGGTKREVAQELGISEKTVGHHIEHIYDKLGVSTRAAAVMEAMTRGLFVGGSTRAEG